MIGANKPPVHAFQCSGAKQLIVPQNAGQRDIELRDRPFRAAAQQEPLLVPVQQIVRTGQSCLIARSIPAHIRHPELAIVKEQERAVNRMAVKGTLRVGRGNHKPVVFSGVRIISIMFITFLSPKQNNDWTDCIIR